MEREHGTWVEGPASKMYFKGIASVNIDKPEHHAGWNHIVNADGNGKPMLAQVGGNVNGVWDKGLPDPPAWAWGYP